MKAIDSISQEFLKSRYEYSSDGFFINRKKVIGVDNSHGYFGVGIRIEGKVHTISYARLIWLWHYGKLPPEIDHINKVKRDNRIGNLRECTKSQNGANRKTPKPFKTPSGRFQAILQINNKTKFFGSFLTEDEAQRRINEVKNKHFGEFAFGNNNT